MNNSSNDSCPGSSACEEHALAPAIPYLVDAWLVPLVFALIMTVGLLGNSLVLYVISKQTKMWTATDIYIANLAMTDITFLVCCVPFTATLYLLPSWIFGDFMCKFVSYIQQVSAQATCLTLTVMSVDRWYVTAHPLRSLQCRTPRVATVVNMGIWIVPPGCVYQDSVAVLLQNITDLQQTRTITTSWTSQHIFRQSLLRFMCIKYEYTSNKKCLYTVRVYTGSVLVSLPVPLYTRTLASEWFGPQVFCAEIFPTTTHRKAFILYNFLAVYMLPLVTICVCYLAMLYQMGRPAVEPIDNNYQLQVQTERSAAVRAKVSRMVLVIVQLFIVCWGPIQLFILAQAFSPHFRENYYTYKVKIWAHCMSYSNSCINPIVYVFMGANFRKAFKKTCYCCYKQRVAVGQQPNANANTEMHYAS